MGTSRTLDVKAGTDEGDNKTAMFLNKLAIEKEEIAV